MDPLSINNILSKLSQVSGGLAGAVKSVIGKAAAGVNLGAAAQTPSRESASRANFGATSTSKTTFQNAATITIGVVAEAAEAVTDAADEAAAAVGELKGASGLLRIRKGAAAEKKEGKREVSTEDEADSEDLFEELLGEVKGEGIDADAGGGGAGEEGTFGGQPGQGGARKAPAQEMVTLLKNLDPTKDIQTQIDEHLTHPAWKTESGQAKIAQFIFEHINASEAALQTKVKMYVDKHTEQAVLKALQREMAAKGVSSDQQTEIDKKFTQYFSLVATEATTPKDEIDFMNALANALPGLNGEELTISFRNQLLHQIGLSMRKLSTFDDRAELMTCNMAIKTPRAINHLTKDFAGAIPRIERAGLTPLAIYVRAG